MITDHHFVAFFFLPTKLYSLYSPIGSREYFRSRYCKSINEGNGRHLDDASSILAVGFCCNMRSSYRMSFFGKLMAFTTTTTCWKKLRVDVLLHSCWPLIVFYFFYYLATFSQFSFLLPPSSSSTGTAYTAQLDNCLQNFCLFVCYCCQIGFKKESATTAPTTNFLLQTFLPKNKANVNVLKLVKAAVTFAKVVHFPLFC